MNRVWAALTLIAGSAVPILPLDTHTDGQTSLYLRAAPPQKLTPNTTSVEPWVPWAYVVGPLLPGQTPALDLENGAVVCSKLYSDTVATASRVNPNVSVASVDLTQYQYLHFVAQCSRPAQMEITLSASTPEGTLYSNAGKFTLTEANTLTEVTVRLPDLQTAEYDLSVIHTVFVGPPEGQRLDTDVVHFGNIVACKPATQPEATPDPLPRHQEE